MSEFHAVVDAEPFYDAFRKASRSAAKKSQLPILEEASVRFDGESCILTGTNLGQWCQATLPADGDAFSFVFTNTRTILTACRRFSGQLEFAFTCDPTDSIPDPEGNLTMRCGERSLTCRTIPASEFPAMPVVKEKQRYPFHPEKLFERFKRVKYAVSHNGDRPARCCVEFRDDRIFTVDGYRLAVNRDPAFRVDAPFTVPPAALDELVLFKGVEDCSITVGDTWIGFESSTLRLITRTPGIDDLDIDKAIPKQCEMEFPICVDALWHEVDYLRTFLSRKVREPIRFDGRTLALKTPDGTYTAGVGLPPISVRGYNAKYLLDGLEQFRAKKADIVTMKVGHPHSPLILTDGEDELAMILPVRLKNAA